MIRCQFALLAKGVIRDHETNSISIFSVLEQFQFPSFPVFFPEVVYLAYLIRDTDVDAPNFESTVRFKLEGTIVLETNMMSNFQDKKGNRLILRIGGLPIPNAGNLTIELLRKDNGQVLHVYEMKILTMVKPPEVAPQNEPVVA